MTELLGDAARSRTNRALRHLSPPDAGFWLVRPNTHQIATAVGLVLFHHLPGVLVALSGVLVRHG
jgi:hypothetical protein